jgi:hypothetical protein
MRDLVLLSTHIKIKATFDFLSIHFCIFEKLIKLTFVRHNTSCIAIIPQNNESKANEENINTINIYFTDTKYEFSKLWRISEN